MSMILFIWCNCDYHSHIDLICVCDVAHDWVPYPFCETAMCDSKKTQSHSEKSDRVNEPLIPNHFMSHWKFYGILTLVKLIQTGYYGSSNKRNNNKPKHS